MTEAIKILAALQGIIKLADDLVAKSEENKAMLLEVQDTEAINNQIQRLKQYLKLRLGIDDFNQARHLFIKLSAHLDIYQEVLAQYHKAKDSYEILRIAIKTKSGKSPYYVKRGNRDSEDEYMDVQFEDLEKATNLLEQEVIAAKTILDGCVNSVYNNIPEKSNE